MTDENAKIINDNFQDLNKRIEELLNLAIDVQKQVDKCTEDIAILTKRIDTYELHTSADSYNNILGACK